MLLLSSSLYQKYLETVYMSLFSLFCPSKIHRIVSQALLKYQDNSLDTEKNSSFFSVWLFKKNTLIFYHVILMTKSLKSCPIQVKEQWAVQAAMSSVCFQTKNLYIFQIHHISKNLFLHSPRFMMMLPLHLIPQEYSSNELTNYLITIRF